MFTIDEYKVTFYHEIVDIKYPCKPDDTKYDFFIKYVQATTCFILSPNGIFLASETVYKYYKDQNNFNKARKYALSKALYRIFPGEENKEIRAKFWKAYFDKMGKIK